MFRLYDINTNELPLPDGVTPLDIFISSIERERVTDRLEGVNGKIEYGYTYTDRDISLKMFMESHDTRDYRLQRDSLNATLDKVAYVSEEYQRGKKYRINVDERFIPERLPNTQRYADVEVNCSMPGLPFAESIGTTADIDKNGVDANSELWGFGMGLIANDDSLKYTHTGTSFRIYNAGDVPIHPFEQELKITISGVQGSTNFLELINNTTGETFRINESVSDDKKIVLDGPNITNNGLQYFRKTNRKFISLVPGWNEFSIKGATSAVISFDFRYYYL